mmetsp:Transcript_6046/g.18018  ORF Transcript_6046/g.18018 Transcript_6046/m.18018 type:complete len:109 (+) Transcript_6046:977-1303(+)
MKSCSQSPRFSSLLCVCACVNLQPSKCNSNVWDVVDVGVGVRVQLCVSDLFFGFGAVFGRLSQNGNKCLVEEVMNDNITKCWCQQNSTATTNNDNNMTIDDQLPDPLL